MERQEKAKGEMMPDVEKVAQQDLIVDDNKMVDDDSV
jgi:hypothetical protein